MNDLREPVQKEEKEPVKKSRKTISAADCIVNLVIVLGFGALMLYAPQIITIGFDAQSGVAGCYNVFAVPKLLEGRIFLILMTLVGAVREVLRLVLRKRTPTLLYITAACDAVCIGFACAALLRPDVLNPALVQAVKVAMADAEPPVFWAMTHLNAAFLIVIAAASAIDLICEAYYAFLEE